MLEFTSELRSDKMLVAIAVCLIGGDGYTSGSHVYVDDVSILSSVPFGLAGFEWVVSPDPIVYDSDSFMQRMGVACTFDCTVFDSNGSATEDGTFSVQTLVDRREGVIVDGEFVFSLVSRGGPWNKTEYINIDIVLTDRSFEVRIMAQWMVYDSDGDGIPDDWSDDDSQGSWYTVPNYVQYIVLFMILQGPALVLAAVGSGDSKRAWGKEGYMAGTVFGASLGLVIGVVPFWLLFVTVLLMVSLWRITS